ncbi:hypothetical protein CVU83_00790 [Candidatus Falkowbacteria bacterium HGW-Falkowbacteria-2]|jgi:hypothetical protein|uniref:MotA/TolQ/ExbB proton channel domain-containing protein n=1 Tax=Candidatus Falkowbacteria bacterium HGW-Falkowbacteria-2 TaxID=2013769 RepID=A0A2N2E2Y8_9BACT|nr:MAG: hypothetical protein CVU83_00790 [Candidatus Falkowbacteria bacterium HGW-Falkowbacteria-2]
MKNAIFSIIFVIGFAAGIILILGLFSAVLYIFGEGGDPGTILRFLREPAYLTITIILAAFAAVIGYFKRSLVKKFNEKMENFFA